MKKSITKIIVVWFVFMTTTTAFAQSTAKKSTKKNAATVTQKLPPNTKIFYIDAERAKCEGVTTMQCLMVKKTGQKEYELFYDNIEGFNFEEGNTYTIWVREELKTPPIAADESMYKYVYVKTIAKKNSSNQNNTTVKDDISKPLSGMNFSKQTTLVVNEEKAQCEGNPDATCLMIKQKGAKEFEIFYQGIAGFVFEQGYRQTILVSERHVANPMIKQTEPIYTLIKVLKKEKIGDGIPVKTNPIKHVINSDIPINNAITKILEINYETTACEANPNVQCLLARERGTKSYEIFNHKIDGFDFEAGNNYTIAIQENEIGQYKLVSIINKTKFEDAIIKPTEVAAEIITLSVLDKKWTIKEIRESDSSILAIDDDNLSIKINTIEKPILVNSNRI
jgi:hypothetical protein